MTRIVLTAMTMAALAGSAVPVWAAERILPTVVVHFRNAASIQAGALADAEREVAGIYAVAGVHVAWAYDGAAKLAPCDGAFHVDVVILSRKMVLGNDLRGIGDQRILGEAVPPARRVVIFYQRVVRHALATGTGLSRVLGAVIAHEIGHTLLPTAGHSPSGLMQAVWDGRIPWIPRFTDEDAAAIRRFLDSMP